jgi:hypothetical protein
MWYKDNLEKAAGYLARTLLEKKDVHYSVFYDGTDETRLRVLVGSGFRAEDYLDEGEDPSKFNLLDIDEPVEGYIDEAAAVFENEGLVERIWLEGETLSDGEPAYRIKLTASGEEKLGSGHFPKFRNLDM